MKKLLSIMILLLIASVSFAQLGLNKSYSKTESDLRYNKVSDNVNPHDSVYFKDETYSKGQVSDMASLASEPSLLRQFRMFFPNVVAIPFSAYSSPSLGGAYTDARAYAVQFVIEDTIQVNKIGYGTGVAAVTYVSDEYNGLGLYSYSAGTATKIDMTANDGTMFNTAGYFEKSLTTSHTLLPGVYYVRVLSNSSSAATAPSYLSWGLLSTQIPMDGTGKVATYSNTQINLSDAFVPNGTSNPSIPCVWLSYVP